MRIHTSGPIVSLFFTVALMRAFAHSYGPAPRVTGGPGDNERACTLCHVGTALNGGAGSVNIALQSGKVYIPGIKQRITVTVADPDQQRWGFEFAARLNSDPANAQAGQFTPVDNFTQVICEDASIAPCSGVSFIQHTSAGTRIGTKNGASFQFDWTPPASAAGPVTFFAAGNAANGDSTSTGDHIYTTSVQLTPVAAVAPTITAASLVSAATNAAGPVAANSWVTVYGSNLSATTRSWQDSDFLNGGFPVSLDGVSVVLTANGAPRRAYIGYVSPRQVNFLIASDQGANPAVQVQVKNPAGITAQFPIAVQAPAPQFLTLDGKYVSAAHADNTIAAKAGLLASGPTAPAVPGETITLYATGCGATNPALVSGQIPTQPNSLAAPPTVSIGGLPAPLVSATVLPGTGGIYQIKVQVPANAANGDLPVVAQIGSVSTASTLITVQR